MCSWIICQEKNTGGSKKREKTIIERYKWKQWRPQEFFNEKRPLGSFPGKANVL